MTPYYQDAHVTLYHGDCREVLPTITTPNAIVSDPPYGTGWVRGGGRVGEFSARHERPEWDVFSTDWLHLSPGSQFWVVFAPQSRADETMAAIRDSARVDWRKTNPRPNGPDRDAIVVGPVALPRGIEFSAYNGDTPHHPCQKPHNLMLWCCQFVRASLVVLDPFMGSGSTLVAAKALGRVSIGVEAEERYCEIAAERCRQEVLDFGGAA